jgi:hypothetical protein
MKKKRSKKHPAKMTSDELAEHVFHPKVLKAAKEHVERVNLPKPPRSSK